MLLSPRQNGLTSLFMEVRLFKGSPIASVQRTQSILASHSAEVSSMELSIVHLGLRAGADHLI